MSLSFDYLKKEAPELYAILNSNRCYDERIPTIEVLSTSDHRPNLKLITSTGNLTVHSNYAPDKEAEKIYNSMGYQPRKLTVAWGFGLGYQLDFYLEKHPNDDLIILEPTYAILAHAIRQRDLSFYFRQDSKIRVLIGVNTLELSEWLCGFYNFHRYDGVQFLELGSYQRFFKAELEQVKKEFYRIFAKYVSNVVTVMESGSAYTENCLRNVRFFGQFPWAAELFQQFKDVPAIVISAGPSLYQHLEQLKTIGDRAVLIAVDTAWPILRKYGVRPHFVCTADPNLANFIHIQDEDNSGVWLVVEPMTYYKTLEIPNIKAFVANFDGYYSGYLARYSSNSGKLLSWGSIASTCFDLARKISANPIIFVGQDLSYTRLLTHCPGSRFDVSFYQSIEYYQPRYLYSSYMSYHVARIYDKPLKPMTDIYQKTVFTQHNLSVYAEWFHDQFRQTKQKVINASEAGILRDNCEIATFSETIEKHLITDHQVTDRIQAIYEKPCDYNFSGLKNDLLLKIDVLQIAEEKAFKKQQKYKVLLELKDQYDQPDKKQQIRDSFNELSRDTDCDPTDPDIKLWVEHENQKAEMFFKRQMSKYVGRELGGKLIEESANLYYNHYESKIHAYRKLTEFLSLALSSCNSAMSKTEKG